MKAKGTHIGEGYDRMKDAVLTEMRKHFRPEFLNRVDETIVFHALREDQLKRIVDIQLHGLQARLAERNITLTLTDAAKVHVVKTGYDPSLGARPLKRVIQKEIENKLAKMLLTGEVADGRAVTVDYDAGYERLAFAVG